ncbi:hypothetical protein D3C83_324360 [compost metagenome]
MDLVAGDNLDGRRRLGKLLRPPGNGGDFEIRELLDTEIGELARIDRIRGTGNRGCRREHRSN